MIVNMQTRPRGMCSRLHASPQTNYTTTNHSISADAVVQAALNRRRPPRPPPSPLGELILQQREAMTEIRGSPVQKLEAVGAQPVA